MSVARTLSRSGRRKKRCDDDGEGGDQRPDHLAGGLALGQGKDGGIGGQPSEGEDDHERDDKARGKESRVGAVAAQNSDEREHDQDDDDHRADGGQRRIIGGRDVFRGHRPATWSSSALKRASMSLTWAATSTMSGGGGSSIGGAGMTNCAQNSCTSGWSSSRNSSKMMG